MPMDDVQHFETSLSDVADGLELEAGVVFTLVVFGVNSSCCLACERPCPLALTDIESLAVSWIDQPVYVIAQRLVISWKLSGHGSVVGVVVGLKVRANSSNWTSHVDPLVAAIQ